MGDTRLRIQVGGQYQILSGLEASLRMVRTAWGAMDIFFCAKALEAFSLWCRVLLDRGSQRVHAIPCGVMAKWHGLLQPPRKAYVSFFSERPFPPRLPVSPS